MVFLQNTQKPLPSEDMAEVFSHLMSNGNYDNIRLTKFLNKKIKFIRDQLREIDNSFYILSMIKKS